MNEFKIQPAIPASATGLAKARTAVLVLEPGGKVTGANEAAHALWQVADSELTGEFFPRLFSLDIVSEDPEMLVAQWEVLLSAVLGKDAVLQVAPREGAPVPMSVRCERLVGGFGGFIATVDPAAALIAAAARPEGDPAATLQLFAEKGTVGFFDINLRTRQVLYSPAWKRMLGYSEADLADTYDAWLGLMHPDDSAAAPDKAGRKFKVGSRPFNVEFRMRHKLGHWAWVQCVGLQIADAAGEPEHAIGIQIDATERKEIEEASIAGDARLAALSDDGPLPAFEIDPVAGVSWFSQAWVRLFGEPADPKAGIPVEGAPQGFEAWALAQAPGQHAFCVPATLRGADGKPIQTLLGLQRTLTRKGALERLVGFACPLPDSAAGAGQPAGANPLAEEALAAVAEGVIVTDARRTVVFANPSAARLLRRPIESLAGRSLPEVFSLVSRLSGQPGDDPVDRALSATGPLPLHSQEAVLIEGADPVSIVWTAKAAYGPDSLPRGVAIVFRDPEEMSLTPEEVIKANRFESLGLLAGGIAHDFNNLLTTILGGISLAKDNRDSSALADSEKACLTAKGLTKQLLAFAKGGAGAQTVCASREILEDAVKIAAAGSTAEITVSAPDEIAPVKVDRAQILQVFQNLIVNALQAMPPAPHKARVQVRAAGVRLADGQISSLAAGDYVEFEVRDNGSGIPAENLEKIWDPFFTTKKHGTGLGLATVLSIVRKHGGEIGLESTIGVGTAFSVYLPASAQPVEVRARSAPSLRFGTGRILFMDDDDQICSLTSSMLQSLDYKFDIAKNGDEAIALYKRYLNIGRPYDCVIMDLTVVGGMGGDEAFAAIHELDPDVRAIVSSGYDNDDMARRYLETGFCGYLTKPYRVTDLGKVIKAVLG